VVISYNKRFYSQNPDNIPELKNTVFAPGKWYYTIILAFVFMFFYYSCQHFTAFLPVYFAFFDFGGTTNIANSVLVKCYCICCIRQNTFCTIFHKIPLILLIISSKSLLLKSGYIGSEMHFL